MPIICTKNLSRYELISEKELWRINTIKSDEFAIRLPIHIAKKKKIGTPKIVEEVFIICCRGCFILL